MSKKRAVSQSLHDVIVVAEDNRLFRFPVREKDGAFVEPPIEMQPLDPGYRKVMTVVDGSADRGAAFAVLPIKPDPATSSVCCYVVNAGNVHPDNDWTRSDWSDEPSVGAADGSDQSRRAPQDPTALELLIAGPKGRLYSARIEADGSAGSFKQVDADTVGRESEVWAQLRNGVVAGSVRRQGAAKGSPPVSLINLTSLLKEVTP